MNQIKCIPNYNSLLTIDLSNYSHYSHYIFCQNDDKPRIRKINLNINHRCKQNCPDSCKEVLFFANYQGWKKQDKQKIYLNFEPVYFQIIKFLANMTFLQLVLNIVNLFNAWHGLSFNRVLKILFIFFRKYRIFDSEKIRIIISSSNYFSILQTKFEVSILCIVFKIFIIFSI